jgi:hypothetical protein
LVDIGGNIASFPLSAVDTSDHDLYNNVYLHPNSSIVNIDSQSYEFHTNAQNVHYNIEDSDTDIMVINDIDSVILVDKHEPISNVLDHNSAIITSDDNLCFDVSGDHSMFSADSLIYDINENFKREDSLPLAQGGDMVVLDKPLISLNSLSSPEPVRTYKGMASKPVENNYKCVVHNCAEDNTSCKYVTCIYVPTVNKDYFDLT